MTASPYAVVIIQMAAFQLDEGGQIIEGFPDFASARDYARRRLRDSLEQLRGPGIGPDELRRLWSIQGEDAMVIGGAESYAGASELELFLDQPATAEERDWPALEAALGLYRLGGDED